MAEVLVRTIGAGANPSNSKIQIQEITLKVEAHVLRTVTHSGELKTGVVTISRVKIVRQDLEIGETKPLGTLVIEKVSHKGTSHSKTLLILRIHNRIEHIRSLQISIGATLLIEDRDLKAEEIEADPGGAALIKE